MMNSQLCCLSAVPVFFLEMAAFGGVLQKLFFLLGKRGIIQKYDQKADRFFVQYSQAHHKGRPVLGTLNGESATDDDYHI